MSFEAEFLTEETSARLFLDGQALALPQVEAVSGVKCSDGRTTRWAKRQEAFVEVGRQMLVKNCQPVQ
jgi:membrane-bound inhibitor of C-type lysozyme